MKKLIILLTIISAQITTAQKDNYMSFSVGADIKNLTTGSILGTGTSLDMILQFNMVSKNIEVNIGYEFNPKLDFSKYTFGLGYHFPLYSYLAGKEIKTTFIPTIEPTLVNRRDNWGGGLGDSEQVSSHLSLGLTLSLNWDLTDNFSVQYSMNALPRTDLSSMYPEEMYRENITVEGIPVVCSHFLKLVYRIER